MDEEIFQLNEKISDGAKVLLDNAFNNIAGRLPNYAEKEKFLERIKIIGDAGIDAVINGQDYQQHLIQGGYETARWIANHYADAILNNVASQFPRGKTRDEIFNALQTLSRTGIESFCSGDSVEQVKAALANCAKGQLKSYVEKNSQRLANDVGKNMYRALKTSGRGSRKVNRQIKSGTEIVSSELGNQIVVNFSDVIDGRKKFGDAVVDVVVDTGKNSAVTFGKKKGAEIIADACKDAMKIAEKKIQNEVLRNVATKGLKNLSNANTVVQVAGAVYDIGVSMKRLLDGEITATEFAREIGEKGSAVIVSGVTSMLGTVAGAAIAGPVGAYIGGAIGSMVGYVANNMFYGAVMQAFDEAELSRKRYEAIHEFCENSISEMRRQRAEFERKTAEFLSNRQQVIDRSLDDFEASMRRKDFNGVTAALNGIAEEFGGVLQFQTFDEFDEFMQDEDSVLRL